MFVQPRVVFPVAADWECAWLVEEGGWWLHWAQAFHILNCFLYFSESHQILLMCYARLPVWTCSKNCMYFIFASLHVASSCWPFSFTRANVSCNGSASEMTVCLDLLQVLWWSWGFFSLQKFTYSFFMFYFVFLVFCSLGYVSLIFHTVLSDLN